MTNKELVNILNPENGKNNLWKEAKERYDKAVPNNQDRIGCSSCRRKIYNWLRKN